MTELEAALSRNEFSQILVVEDDAELGAIMKDVLMQQWDVTLVDTIRSAREASTETLFAAMVIDRRLPDGDGMELVEWIRSRSDPTPMLILTALGQVADRVAGLNAGANDYLVKPFSFDELNARLRALTRDYLGCGDGIDIGSWVFFPGNMTIESPYMGRILLTEKESALLSILARNPNRVYSRTHLLHAVFEHGEQQGTVDTYVHYLRRKTERGIVETVRGFGYRLGRLL